MNFKSLFFVAMVFVSMFAASSALDFFGDDFDPAANQNNIVVQIEVAPNFCSGRELHCEQCEDGFQKCCQTGVIGLQDICSKCSC